VAQTLKQLTKLWYAKLKKQGFVDIEQDEIYLKRWSNEFTRKDENVNNRSTFNVKPKKVRNKKDEFQGKHDYYYYASHFLNEHKFESERDRIIWEYHTSGISMRNISKLLKRVKIKISRDTVNRVISNLAERMKAQYFK
jgi:hypothetical protein